MALSTISPNLSEQFAALVNLAVVTNVVPYIVALSALTVIMKGAGVTGATYTRNLAVTVVAIVYSVYALYTSGMEAVMGGMLVMGLGWLIWTFMAPRFVATPAAIRQA
jgi:putrescine:ornithine antiporter